MDHQNHIISGEITTGISDEMALVNSYEKLQELKQNYLQQNKKEKQVYT
jgi:hypothetical protein